MPGIGFLESGPIKIISQAGYAGPGGLHEWTPERNNSGCIGGITGYIDKAFFSTPHIYGNPTAKSVYSASAFDPEGLFGSLTSMFQVFLGYQAGYILQVCQRVF